MGNGVIKYGKTKIIIAAISLSIFLLVRCMNKTDDIKKQINRFEFNAFAGSQSCMKCHKEISESHLNTAYHLSSALV